MAREPDKRLLRASPGPINGKNTQLPEKTKVLHHRSALQVKSEENLRATGPSTGQGRNRWSGDTTTKRKKRGRHIFTRAPCPHSAPRWGSHAGPENVRAKAQKKKSSQDLLPGHPTPIGYRWSGPTDTGPGRREKRPPKSLAPKGVCQMKRNPRIYAPTGAPRPSND